LNISSISKGKGKKRAIEIHSEVPPVSVGSSSEPPHPTKRSMCSPGCKYYEVLNGSWTVKRAETRPCPICDELIPLRLLAKHAELESERVEEVIQKVGSTEVVYDEMTDE